MILTTYLLFIYLFLYWSVHQYGAKTAGYSHIRDSISELAETGSKYEKAVSYRVFLPFGLACILLALLSWNHQPSAAVLSGAMGGSYFLCGLFPCDKGTPLLGSWKNTLHNLAAGAGYILVALQLSELTTYSDSAVYEVSLKLLAIFLAVFLVGWPKAFIGIAQRLAETSVFLCIGLLLLQS